MFFRKKRKECFHDWTLIDYTNYVDLTLGIEEHYVLGCNKCNNTRYVDEYIFQKMEDKGLIKINL